jgi:hypothetical protein
MKKRTLFLTPKKEDSKRLDSKETPNKFVLPQVLDELDSGLHVQTQTNLTIGDDDVQVLYLFTVTPTLLLKMVGCNG